MAATQDAKADELNTPMDVSKTLCRIDDIEDGKALSVDVESATGGFNLVLVRQGARVFAYHNECPHAGRRLDWSPGRFLIDGGFLICAAHGAMFGIETGRCFSGPCVGANLATMPVNVIDGEVQLARGPD
jgi:nitrite reductase/ring-hydroxylating ferredoxin subunit